MKLLNTSLMLMLSLLLFAACERDEMALDQADATAAVSESEATAFFDEIDLITTEALGLAENGRSLTATTALPACASIAHNTSTGITTIDFGAGCADARGNVRAGKIIVTRSGGRFVESGYSHTTMLEGYSVNGIQVAGRRVVTNITTPDDEHLKFSVALREGKVSWPDGTFALRTLDHQRSWVRSSMPASDEWHLTGSASGINRGGQPYRSNIHEALILKATCLQQGVGVPVAGSIFVDRPEKPVIVLDYGKGNCDSEATVSMNGLNRTVNLRR